MADRFQNLYAARAAAALPSAIREICKLAAQPDIQSLAGGWPDPAVFPNEDISRLAVQVLAEHGDDVLQYGTTEGLAPLRQALATRLEAREGYAVDPERIVMIHGSQQGIDLSCRVLVEPGDVVAVGLPTYFGGFGAVRSAGGQAVGVAGDADGIDPDALNALAEKLSLDGRKLKALYCIPNFQNPTGASLPLARRMALVELAERHDFIIIEDDPYGELRFSGEPLPSLSQLDEAGRVILLRSLSKTFAPGLRMAWMHAEAGILRRMVIAKQFVDACTNSFGQFLALAFLESGGLDKRVAANISHYRRKRDVLLKALETHMPKGVSWNAPDGGFFIWVTLPAGMDAELLLQQSAKMGVVFVAGAPFFVDGSGQNTLRLSYSQAPTGMLETAVETLSRVIQAHG